MKTLFKNLFISGKNRGGTFGISCFGISCIVSNNFRNFSATNGKNKYTWIRYFPENEYYVNLPCIDTDIETKWKCNEIFNEILKEFLSLIIDNDDKSLFYKLEYFLYLYTNDKNIELIKGVSESGMVLRCSSKS